MDIKQEIIKILHYDNVFLTGGGGVGKSYLCEEIIRTYRQNFRQVVILGSTGISAVQIGGQTLHSFFVFGIANDIDEMKQNDKRSSRKLKELNKILSKCELLIIDEISMVSSEMMDMIRYRLQKGGFDGKILVVGDFFQLPPVRKKTEKNGLFGDAVYAFESAAWEYYDFHIVNLTKPKRTDDIEFFTILNRIRRGEVDEDIMKFLSALRDNVHVWESNPTILFGRNKEAEMMNKQRLNDLESEYFMFPAVEKLHEKTLHAKKFESWKNSLMINTNLELKVGASVLFCTNKKGNYYNGERGEVIAIEPDKIIVQKDDGYEIGVERFEFSLNDIVVKDDEILEVPLATVEQFPLKLAYAITIHKSQGMSIERLICNIDNIFEKSQFYVALSRATNPKELYLYYGGHSFEQQIKRSVEVDDRVKNFYDTSECNLIEEERE